MIRAAHAPVGPAETHVPPPASAWHAVPPDAVLAALHTDGIHGLAIAEAQTRLARVGPNRLIEERPVTLWRVAKEEVTEPMLLLLLAIGVLYTLWGALADALAIFVIITGIACVEIVNEYRAKAAIAALQRLAAPMAPVLRDGRQEDIPTTTLVPGDLVLLGPGERVPADLRLLVVSALEVDESSLTGESAPVRKGVEPVPEPTALADRGSMAYAGTLVTGGKGRGVVVATGMATEIGRIAGLARTAQEPRTPLQTGMRQLAGLLVWVALAFSLLIPLVGVLVGQPWRTMLLTGLTLAFATIPEELPILITVVLGLGALRLAKRHAIVKRLRAAETLGSVSIVASDKTGTITENHMTVTAVWLPGEATILSPADPRARRLLELGALANAARWTEPDEKGGWVGDPTDVALAEAATASGVARRILRREGLVAEFPFDDRRRLVSAVYQQDGGLLVAVKGAPEAVLPRCARQGSPQEAGSVAGQTALVAAAAMAARGLRVLALAWKRLPSPPGASASTPVGGLPLREACEAELAFAGLVGLQDPPRPEVGSALTALRAAGIRVLLLTGDHPATARAVAEQVGIDGKRVCTGRELEGLDDEGLGKIVGEVSVFARIAPEHKLRIVRALQARGEAVAVTGDGVNDAPALKEAAIGVAMGQTGTDVAKEAAGMVLGDDNFATIAVAVREGRVLFENLRKAVRYYLAAKVALVSSALVAVLAHLPVPFSPLQIIVTELFMDLGASVAFTTERAEGDVMARPPRDPRSPFMDRSMQAGILGGGLSLGAAVLGVYGWAFTQGLGTAHAQTLAFATWMVGHVLLAFHMRSERQPLLRLGLLSNPTLLVWAAAAVTLAALGPFLPLLGAALKLTTLTPGEWALVVATPMVTTGWWEVWKSVRWRDRKAGLLR